MIAIQHAGLVCCSDPIPQEHSSRIDRISAALYSCGIECTKGNGLCAPGIDSYRQAADKAAQLNAFWADSNIDAIFDISGGDLANQILDHIDYSQISWSGKELWGYSDLTCILNAIYTKAGKSSVLYTMHNLIRSNGLEQNRLLWSYLHNQSNALFQLDARFLQGYEMEGILLGGNIRCFLKLAGTPYFPDLTQKILLLEAQSGTIPRITAYFSQLKQMDVFSRISGILLGTFTQLEQENNKTTAYDILKQFIPSSLPVAATAHIGHGDNSRAAHIGTYYRFAGTSQTQY